MLEELEAYLCINYDPARQEYISPARFYVLGWEFSRDQEKETISIKDHTKKKFKKIILSTRNPYVNTLHIYTHH